MLYQLSYGGLGQYCAYLMLKGQDLLGYKKRPQHIPVLRSLDLACVAKPVTLLCRCRRLFG